jgi:hypothetical protein
VGTAGSPVVNGGALGTPSSGTVTNLTGTASININGTVGATTANTGAFTTLSATGATTLNGNAIISVTDNTNAALRITQTGTGNALLVEDNANPDATPFVVTADGNVGIGSAAPTVLLNMYSATSSIAQLTGDSTTTFTIRRASDDTTSGALGLNKRRGTIASPIAVQSGDTLGSIIFNGWDGTANTTGAQISASVDGTPGTSDMPGRLVFSTTADGASSLTERVRINSSGLTTVGFTAATGTALSTTVAAKFHSANTTYTDGTTAASGTVAHGTIASFDNPAIAATNATVTYTNASTLYIDGAPTAGTNVTITNPYSLYVAAGGVYFGGAVSAADPIVQQSDIGTAPNEIPLNQYLGNLAYQDAANIAGPVRIGANSSAIPLAIGPSDITPGVTVEGQIISSDATGAHPLLSVRRSTATGNATIAQFTSSGTAASPTAVVSGRGLGRNDWYGFDGTNYVRSATIAVIADTTVSTGVMPGRISFQTASTSAGVPVERMRIDSSGNVVSSVPTTPPTLSTNGTMVFNLTSDTNLRVSVRGSDGVTRTANITLA